VCHFDPQVLVGGILLPVVIDISDHGRSNGYTKDIVRIREEAYAGNETSSGVEPLTISKSTEVAVVD
jgi:hypothetical protein